MSHAVPLTPSLPCKGTARADAASAREVRTLLTKTSARLAGKGRGRDHAADQRVPRRNSYEETDARAKPWAKIGDGSVAEGMMHQEALVEAATDLRHQLWTEYPLSEIRRRRADLAEQTAELEQLMARSPADIPAGRPAALRVAIADHEAWLKRANGRLRRIDVEILRALVSFLDFATGRLFPQLETIAAEAGCHKNSVIDALRRLRDHGLISWVRRTTRTGNAGEFAPQLEQTSNAYYFDHRRKMASRTWQRYWQRLCVKLKRLGARRPAAGAHEALRALDAPATPLQAALASLSFKLASGNP